MSVLAYFLEVFILTNFIECGIVLTRFKSRKWAYCIFLCNLLTNPALNFISLVVYSFLNTKLYWVSVIFIEIIVFLLEAYVIYLVMNISKNKALLWSFIINSSSFLIGILVFQ